MHQCGRGLNKWKRDAAFVHWRTHGCILNSRRTIKLDINFHTYLNKSATQAAFFCLNPDWVWQSSNWAWKLTRPAFSVLFNVWTRPEPDTVDVSSCSEFVLPWLLLACLHWYHMSLIWNYYLFSSKGLDVNRSQPIPWKSSLHFFVRSRPGAVGSHQVQVRALISYSLAEILLPSILRKHSDCPLWTLHCWFSKNLQPLLTIKMKKKKNVWFISQVAPLFYIFQTNLVAGSDVSLCFICEPKSYHWLSVFGHVWLF